MTKCFGVSEHSEANSIAAKLLVVYKPITYRMQLALQVLSMTLVIEDLQ
jgi:hypothetical protein